MAYTRTKYYDVQDRRTAILQATAHGSKSISDICDALRDKDDPLDTGPNYYTIRADIQELMKENKIRQTGKDGATKLYQALAEKDDPYGLVAKWPAFFLNPRDTPNLRDVIRDIHQLYGLWGVDDAIMFNHIMLRLPNYMDSPKTSPELQVELNVLRKHLRDNVRTLKRLARLAEAVLDSDEVWSLNYLTKLSIREDMIKRPEDIHEVANFLTSSAAEFINTYKKAYVEVWRQLEVKGATNNGEDAEP